MNGGFLLRGRVAAAPLRVALATDSLKPSGVGAHMLALARHFPTPPMIVAHGDIDLLARARAWGLPTRALGPDWQSDLRGFDIIHVHAGVGWEGHMLTWAAHEAGAGAIVRTEHLPWLVTEADQRADYREADRLLDALIAVSPSAAATYRTRPECAAPVHVVPNGIDAPASTRPRAVVRAALELHPEAPVALAAGRFTPQKAMDVLIRAARGLPAGAQLLIAGDGPGLAADAELVASCCAPVRLLGYRADLPDLIAAADLCVLPSRFEGLPLFALEAMAAGRAVLGADVVGTRDAVIHGETGWLVPPDDPGALGAALARWLPDRAALARAGRVGARVQAARFTARRMATGTLAVYHAALARAALAEANSPEALVA